MGSAADVAAWVLELRAEALPATVRHQLRRAILDGLGAAIAGTVTPTAVIAARYAAAIGRDGPSTVLASGDRLATPMAILANVTAANALDIDDGYRLVKGHPGAFLVTPAIAVAEEHGAEHLLPAIAAGYEVALRAGIATHRTYRHYHASGSWGALGTAACLGRLMGLDAGRLRWAFGLAEYHAPLSPIERCLADPAMTKDGIAAGAFAGAVSVGLAEQGFTGNRSLLEDPANADLMADLGETWRLLDLYFKPYPCCRWAQPAVDGVLRLKREHRLACRHIRQVTVHTFREAAALQLSPPASSEEAQYSLGWPVAVALLHDTILPCHVLEPSLSDPENRRAVECVRAVVEPEIQARFPAEALAWVEIETHDGTSLRGELLSARGDPHVPLSDGELEQKFRTITTPVIGAGAERLLARVAAIEERDGAARLVEAVRELTSAQGRV